MIRPVFSGQSWAVSRPRTIDDQTLLDILGLLEYSARRDERRENAGYVDPEEDQPNDEPIELMFVYVLDAIGVPAEGAEGDGAIVGEHPRFTRVKRFKREWFEELFYETYILDKRLTLPELLERFKAEVATNLARHYG